MNSSHRAGDPSIGGSDIYAMARNRHRPIPHMKYPVSGTPIEQGLHNASLEGPTTRGASVPRVVVEVTSETGDCRSLQLPTGRYRVGTLATCDIVVDDAWVSREHLELLVTEREVRVVDLGSTNGSYFDGAAFRDLCVDSDTMIVIGSSRLRISFGLAEPPAHVVLAAARALGTNEP